MRSRLGVETLKGSRSTGAPHPTPPSAPPVPSGFKLVSGKSHTIVVAYGPICGPECGTVRGSGGAKGATVRDYKRGIETVIVVMVSV